MTTQRGRHRKLRRNILHTVIATALLAGTFTFVDQTINSPTASVASTDTVKPVLVAASSSGSTITLTFDEALGSTTAPIGQFAVALTPADATNTRSSVSVSGNTVQITMSKVIPTTTSVAVTYTSPTQVNPPTANATTNLAIQDLAGNDVNTFTSASFTAGDVTAPTLSSAAVSTAGNQIALTFADSNNLLASNLPAASSFSVDVNGISVTPSSVSISTGTKVANLNLGMTIDSNDVVQVTYTAPVVVADVSNIALQDIAGNDVATFTNTAVTNSSSAPALLSINVSTAAGTTVVLTYNEPLNSTTAPASAFSIQSAGRTIVPTSAVVSGSTIILTLPTGVEGGGSEFIVNYSAPTASSLTTNLAIQDSAGNDGASLPATTSSTSIVRTNNSTVDTVAPTYVSGRVDPSGKSITLTFSEPIVDQTAWSDFLISINGGAFSNGPTSDTAASGSKLTILLTSSTTYTYTDVVRLTFAQSSRSITDASGNATAFFSNVLLTNDSTVNKPPAPTQPPAPTVVTAGFGTVKVNVSPPSSGVTPTNYVVTASPGGATCNVTGSPGSCFISGLTGGVSYTFTSTAYNLTTPSVPSTSSTHVVPLDTTGPSLLTSKLDASGTTLTLTYNELINNSAGGIPTAGSYVVLADGQTISVSSLVVDGQKVVLTLSPRVFAEQVTTVAYNAPTSVSGTSNAALQDLGGIDSTSMTATTVQVMESTIKYCTIGQPTPTQLVDGISVASSPGNNLSTYIDPSTVNNLVSNGNFDTGLETVDNVYIGEKSTKTPKATVPYWLTKGGGSLTYANHERRTTNLTQIPRDPLNTVDRPSRVYFGNATNNNVVWNGTWTHPTVGWSTAAINTGTQHSNASYGTDPVSLEQNISTNPGQVYRMQFFVAGEGPYTQAGLAGFDLTGYQRLFFKVTWTSTNNVGNRYTVYFVAKNNTTNIKFLSWGHVKVSGLESTELVLDTVTVTDCGGPIAQPDVTSGQMGNIQTTNLLVSRNGYDSPSEGTTLVASSVKLCASNEVAPNCTVPAGTPVSVAGVGSYQVDANGIMTFTPLANYVGTPPPISYTVSDSSGGKGTSTYTPTVTPPPMTANPDTTSGPQGSVQTFDLTVNDTPGSGSTITKSSLKLCNVSANPAEVSPNCTVPAGTPVVVAGVGSYVVNTLGVMTFTPVANYTGTPAPLPYIVSDSSNSVGASTYTPTVYGTPTASPDAITDAWDTNQIYSPVTNDTAGAGTTLTASSVRICATGTAAASCTGTTLTVPNQGTYTVNTTTGAVTFDPLPTFTGTATPIQYVVTDSQNQKVTSTITPTVGAPPAPTATADTITTNYDVTQNYTPLSNDTANASFPLLANSVKLCASNETPNNCTQTTLTIANQGTYTVNTTTGAVEFNPLPTFTGNATPVKYQAKDGLDRFVDSTISPIIGAPPVPTASPDAQTTAYDVTQSYTPLSNDSANTNFPLTATSVKLCQPATTNPPAQGEVAPNCSLTSLTTADGVYTVNTTTGAVEFNPAPTFTGTVSSPVSYQVTDSINRTVSSTITPTVGAPPAPSAATDSSSGNFDTNQTINPLTNDTANTNFPLSATSVKLCGTNPVETPNNCTKTALVIAGQGTYTVDPTTGVVTFDPLPTFAGTATPIKYQAQDSIGRFIDSTIAVTVGNPPTPTANPNTSYGAKNATQVFNPLGDDTVTSGFPLDPTSVKLCGTNPVEIPNNCTKTTLEIPGRGTFTVDPVTGYVTFTPVTDFIGTVPTISYVVTDSLGRKANSTIDVVVASDPAMSASLDTSSGNYNTPQTINPLTNDSAGRTVGITGFTTIGTVSIDAASVRFCGPGQFQPNCDKTTISDAAGTYTVNTSTGVVTFTPAATFTGTDVNGPTYQVCNTIGSGWDPVPARTCATAQIIPTVGAPPAPVANTDTDTTAYDTNRTVNPLTNDTANSNFPLNATTVKLCGAGQTPNGNPACDKTTLEVLNQGTYTVNPITGEVTFDPLPSFTGPATPITYQVTDSINRTISSTIAITIGTPPAPSATNDTKTGPYDEDQLISPLTNDSATTAFPFDQTLVKLCGTGQTPPACDKLSVATADGVYTVNPNGTVTFNPDADFTGTATQPVTYQATDMLGRTASATITPTVGAPPVAIAVADALTAAYDTNQTYTPTSNDTANSNFPITATSVKLCGTGQTPPACDKLSVTTADGVYTVDPATGNVTFNPDADFTGLATQPVTYQATDSLNRVINTTITPTVGAPPVAVAVPDAQIAAYDTNQTYTPTSNDTFNSNFPITATSVKLCGTGQTPPACDKLSVTTADGVYTVDPATGNVTFNPDADFTGLATQPVTYQATDSLNRVINTTITPTVGAPPAPSATANTTTGAYDVNQTANLLTNDTPGAPEFPLLGTTVKLCATGQTPPACDKTSLDVANEGTYTVNPSTGLVTFDPLPTFTGAATPVTYQAKDTLDRVVTSTYTPTVGAPPAPSAQPDTSTAAWDVNQTKTVLTNDQPGSSSYPLLAASVKICGASQNPPNCSSTSLQVANEGTYTVNNDGTITFDPLPSFYGDAAPIRYQVSNSIGQTTFTYYTPTVTVPPAPTATPDTIELIPGQSKVFSSIFDGQTGDADPALATKGTGGPDLTNSTVCIIDPATTVCDTDGIVTIAGQGTYTLNPTTGIVTYAALSAATPGAKTPVTYKITDGLGRSVTSTLTPTITPPPVANPDFSTGVQGAIQTLSPVGNDRPGGGASTELYPDTRAQIPSGIFLCAANQPPPDCAASTVTVTDPVTNATLGVLTVAATGLVTFTPEPNFIGTTPPIGYQLPDNLGQKAYSTITITVVPPPAPSATIDTGSAEYNKPVTLKPWINDAAGTRPDNSLRQDGTPYPAPTLVATSIKLCDDNSTFVAMSGTPADCTATKVKTVEGTYEVNATTGEVVFTPVNGFTGTVKYPPTYQIWNNWTGLGGAKSATALLVPTIAPPGAPAATVDITKTKPGTSVVLNPVANDKPGTAALDPTTIRLCGAGEISPACTQMSVTTLDGLYVVEPTTGQVTFTPRDGFTGQATIPYVIKDGLGMIANANLIITVEDTAIVPVAKKTKVGLAKTGGARPDLLLLLGLVAIAGAGGLRVLSRKK